MFTADLTSNSDYIISIFSEKDLNSKLSKFNNVFISTLEKHAPTRTTKVLNRLCPYVTPEIKDFGS